MGYFARQWKLLKHSYLLVLLFLLCAAGMILTINLICYYLYSFVFSNWSARPVYAVTDFPMRLHISITLFIISSMVIVYFAKILLLHSGGAHVAEYYGGSRIENPNDYYTTRYKNIVEELAIASRMPVPGIFVMQQNNNINAFAAGNSPEDAAICISKGALTKLNRDELQAVLAHEFSHIVHRDMRLNMQLIALQASINWISESLWIFDPENYDHPAYLVLIPLIPLLVLFLPASIIGNMFATLLKLGVNRKREFLADASAVHYTRLSIGLIGALKKIGSIADPATGKSNELQSISHMMFVSVSPIKTLFSSHPSIIERIKAIDPDFDENELATLRNHYEKFAPNGMEEDRALGFYSGDNDEIVATQTPVAKPAYKQPGTPAVSKTPTKSTVKPNIIIVAMLLLLSTILFKGGQLFYREMSAIPDQPPGILVSDDPQFHESETPDSFMLKGFKIRTLGTYSIKGRVLAVQHYSSDKLSSISPADFLLGWGMMSDTAMLKTVKRINMIDRSYSYNLEDYSAIEEIYNHSAFTILIPASADIGRTINKVKKNNIVSMSGYVVDVNSPDGWYWNSSTRVYKVDGRYRLIYVVLWVDEIIIH